MEDFVRIAQAALNLATEARKDTLASAVAVRSAMAQLSELGGMLQNSAAVQRATLKALMVGIERGNTLEVFEQARATFEAEHPETYRPDMWGEVPGWLAAMRKGPGQR